MEMERKRHRHPPSVGRVPTHQHHFARRVVSFGSIQMGRQVRHPQFMRVGIVLRWVDVVQLSRAWGEGREELEVKDDTCHTIHMHYQDWLRSMHMA